MHKECANLRLCLLTDTHYTENGTWKDTAENIKRTLGKEAAISADGMVDAIGADGVTDVDAIIHLGDFTDGIESKEVTSQYVNTILSDLQENGVPVYVTLGNHDYNFFRGNTERFTKEEVLAVLQMEAEYYFQDFDAYRIRCLFLYSYDADTPVRYGFPDKEIEWVKETLENTPADYKVIVFCHTAPLYFLDFWSRIIWNGEKLVGILEEYNARDDKQILAYIHGHTHAEHIYTGSSFPIVSIGCNKCEQLIDKIPKGSYAYERIAGTDTQDLWDILEVDRERQKLHFVRFGAGEDRIVDCKKTESTWREAEALKKRSRTTKIWAHRGASGFAPENTLPAFAISKALNVDGIELDVQMTKDGELVVIHDETIDRTSDGSGGVKDYTLLELRRYNFAVNKPGFGFVTIPTLREVYELFQGTDFVINVELKTSVIKYDDSDVTVSTEDRTMPDTRCIEEKVHELTAEMGMEKQVIYSSFSHASILRMQQYVTKEQTAFLFSDGWIDVAEYGAVHGAQALHPVLYYQELEETIKECHEKGMRVNVWTVNEEEHALKLREMGADAIITNHPGKMRDLYFKS